MENKFHIVRLHTLKLQIGMTTAGLLQLHSKAARPGITEGKALIQPELSAPENEKPGQFTLAGFFST